MDQEAKVMIVVAIGITAALIVKTIASAIVRYAEVHRRQEVAVDEQSIRARLERIEVAVDTIAIEVERLGEHQRFNAQLALNRPEPLPKKVNTPH
jgi:hypothetical protein